MYLVVGLGNPGNEYKMTRHNIGFNVIDYIASEEKVKINKIKFKGVYGQLNVNGEKVIFLKPQTYMNLSGDCVVEFCDFFKIPPENVIVISDDMALQRGRIRVRKKGGAGGHNGLKSIIYRLKSEDFLRVRVGIGSYANENMDMVDFVIGKFSKDEIPVLEQAIIKAKSAIYDIIKYDVDYAMNRHNTKS